MAVTDNWLKKTKQNRNGYNSVCFTDEQECDVIVADSFKISHDLVFQVWPNRLQLSEDGLSLKVWHEKYVFLQGMPRLLFIFVMVSPKASLNTNVMFI